jgi:hypothetical protein
MSIIMSAGVSLGPAQTPETADHPFANDLNRRSDSLRRLKPERELKAAIAHGDWRFLGVQGYVVVAPGVAFDDPLYPKEPSDIRVIEGTSDFMIGEAGNRFNTEAAKYAEQYNHMLLKRLRKGKKR